MTQRKEHNLARRDAELAANIPFRNRQDGDLTVRSCSIRFKDLMLTQAELADLSQQPLAGRALFCKRTGSALDEPLFATFGPIPITTHLTGRAFLYSTLGDGEIELGFVTLTNLKIEPKPGGMTALAGVIQATPTLDGRIAEFIDRMGSKVQLALTYEHEAEQQQLPMGNGAGAGESEHDETQPPEVAQNGAASTSSSSDGIGPQTRAELANAGKRRGRRAIDGRKGVQ